MQLQAYIFFYNALIKCDLCSFYICLDGYHTRIVCMFYAFLKINITFAFVFQAESVRFVVLSDSGSDLIFIQTCLNVIYGTTD